MLCYVRSRMHLEAAFLVSLDHAISTTPQCIVQRLNEQRQGIRCPDFRKGLRRMIGNSVGRRCCRLKQRRNPGCAELGKCYRRMAIRVVLSSVKDGSKSAHCIF